MKIMKTKNMLWAALSMTAALVMTACSSDSDNDIVETPAAPQAQKTIPYTVTVSDDAATTRATVSDDPTDRKLYFATGDKLYITGTNIKGVLDIQTGDEGKTTGATFSGELTYSGSGSPASDLSLTATLVSAQQTVGTQVSVDDAGAVTVNYPTAAYCADVATAVQKYSNLTGTSTYSTKSFSLTQQTAFLNFVITFEDGTTTGTALSTVVSNNSAAICTANFETTTEGTDVVAKFVLPVAKGTTLSSANVKFGDKTAISFGASQTLDGKVYNVTKTQAAAARSLTLATTDDVGKIAGADGKIYNTKAAAEAVAIGNAVAMIAYVGTASDCEHGLAIALADENESSKMNWLTAGTTCSSKTATVGTWRLPSAKDWQYMFIGCGSSESYSVPESGMSKSYSGLASKLTTAQGDALQTGFYWSSTENISGEYAWRVSFAGNNAYFELVDEHYVYQVRACLAF